MMPENARYVHVRGYIDHHRANQIFLGWLQLITMQQSRIRMRFMRVTSHHDAVTSLPFSASEENWRIRLKKKPVPQGNHNADLDQRARDDMSIGPFRPKVRVAAKQSIALARLRPTRLQSRRLGSGWILGRNCEPICRRNLTPMSDFSEYVSSSSTVNQDSRQRCRAIYFLSLLHSCHSPLAREIKEVDAHISNPQLRSTSEFGTVRSITLAAGTLGLWQKHPPGYFSLHT